MNCTAFPSTVRSSQLRLGNRFAAFIRRRIARLRHTRLDPQRVLLLADTVTSEPELRNWLLVVASESARVRRALLARATQEFRAQVGKAHAAESLEQLADASLLHAVTELLFRQSGMEPPAPTQRTGRGARVRMAELAARLQAQDALSAAI